MILCRPEIQLDEYAKVVRIVDGADMILVCCHNVLITAPISFHVLDTTTRIAVCSFMCHIYVFLGQSHVE